MSSMDQPPRSPRRWIVFVLLAIAVLYPVSFGPAFWISSRLRDPVPTFHTLGVIYGPVVVVLIKSPKPVQNVAAGYLGLGAPKSVSIDFFHDTSAGLVSSHPGYTYTWLSFQL